MYHEIVYENWNSLLSRDKQENLIPNERRISSEVFEFRAILKSSSLQGSSYTFSKLFFFSFSRYKGLKFDQ